MVSSWDPFSGGSTYGREFHVKASALPQQLFLSTGDRVTFLVVYASIFVEVAFLVQLIIWILAWHERRLTKKEAAIGSPSPLEARAPEIVHGPPAQLPSEVVAEQFLKKSNESPQAVAIVAKEAATAARYELTYESLASKVQNLTKRLFSIGVRQGDIVALVLDRGVHQVASIYATMLSGAAWMPIDTAVPEHRLKELLDCSHPSLLLHQADAAGLQVACWSQSLGVRTATALLDASDLRATTTATESRVHESRHVQMSDCALVIYTSGTTGKPKGIMYSQAMLNHGANATADLMEMDRQSIAFLKTPYIWAVVEWELFPALVRGGTLVVGSASAHKEPQYMAETILAERVSSLVMAPDVLDLLLDVHEQGGQLESLKHVISVGAGLPVTLANRFAKMGKLSARLHNVYGASESSCTVWTVPESGVDTGLWSSRAPVGVPQTGCSVWVLNENLEHVRTGDMGELCFGGQLALGYFEMPELTAEKFVTHPTLGRIYRTGDLARWRAGVLEICGRIDRQVKINGVRVEPEEVETALKGFAESLRQVHDTAEVIPEVAALSGGDKHWSLKQVACVATTSSSQELVAFVSPTLSDMQVKVLREHLESKLPVYYLPKYIFSRDRLPLLPNGKINLLTLVQEANRSVEDCGKNVVMDSLGQMKSLSRAMMLEHQVMQRCYTYWLLGIMVGHWYSLSLGNCLFVHMATLAEGSNMAANVMHIATNGVRPWVNFALAQLGDYQTRFGFVLFKALQDSTLKPGESTARLTLGYEDALLTLLYLLMKLPPDPVRGFEPAEAIHSWFVLGIVLAHLCIALGQSLQIPGWLQILMHSSVCFWAPAWFDPCSKPLPKWLHWTCRWILPRSTWKDFDSCPIMTLGVQEMIMLYVLAFYCSRPGLRTVTGFIDRVGCNTAPWAVLACGVSCSLGAASGTWTSPPNCLKYALWVVQPSLFALSMAWFPLDLSWLGTATLGTYVLHWYPMRYAGFWDILTGILHRLKGMPGLLQLLVLLALPLAFTATLGKLFTYCLVTSANAAHRVWDSARTRRRKATSSPNMTLSGRCNCGGVQYTVSGPPGQAMNCQCGACQRSTGAFSIPFGAFPRKAVKFLKSESLAVNASDTAKRLFCKKCGGCIGMDYLTDHHTLWLALGCLPEFDFEQHKDDMLWSSVCFSESRHISTDAMQALPAYNFTGTFVRDPCGPGAKNNDLSTLVPRSAMPNP